jgi:hypothetical protein
MITETNLKILQPFVSDEDAIIKLSPELYKVNEAEQFYIASNTFMGAILFKPENIDKSMNYKFNNRIDDILNTWENIRKENKYYVTFNRKEMINNIKEQWKEIKTKAKDCDIFLHNIDAVINIIVDINTYNISYNLRKLFPMSDGECFRSKSRTQYIDTDLETNIDFTFNLRYFESILNYIKDREVIIKVSDIKYKAIIISGKDREVIIAPIRERK